MVFDLDTCPEIHRVFFKIIVRVLSPPMGILGASIIMES